jgi:hypothetical protein
LQIRLFKALVLFLLLGLQGEINQLAALCNFRWKIKTGPVPKMAKRDDLQSGALEKRLSFGQWLMNCLKAGAMKIPIWSSDTYRN